MARDDAGASVRVQRRVRHPVAMRKVTRAAARTRRAVRRWFPRDERYFEAFARLRPGAVVSAFHGGRVVGLVLLQRGAVDPFLVERRTFIRLYGVLHGLVLYYAYLIIQRLSARGACYIASVWVAPTFRGAGVGARMLDLARERATGRWTVLARRGEAEQFFARMGFTAETGPKARFNAALRGRTPMDWRPSAKLRRRNRRLRRARRLSNQARQSGLKQA